MFIIQALRLLTPRGRMGSLRYPGMEWAGVDLCRYLAVTGIQIIRSGGVDML